MGLPLSACSQLLLLKLTPSQRLRLMPTTVTITDMDWPTMGTDMPTTDTMATPTLTMATTMVRGPDAEPEADAYYGHYGYGLAHHGYGYGLAHHGYYGYAHPYAYGHYYGKRSADAEPAADAYYGHHYGYAPYGYAHRGYYGYPYAHRGYYGYGYHH